MKNRVSKILLILAVIVLIAGAAYFIYRSQNPVKNLNITDPVNTQSQEAIDYYCDSADIIGNEIIVGNKELLIYTAEDEQYTVSTANSEPVIRLVRAFSKFDRAEVQPVKVSDLISIENKQGVCVTLKPSANKSVKDFQASDVLQIIIY